MEENQVTDASQEDGITGREELKLSLDGRSVDWYLQNLVDIANENGWEFGLTLTTGGSIVSGRLISGRKYFRAFADQFTSILPDEHKNSFREEITGYGANIYDRSEGEPAPPPQFIHLADARYFAPGQIPMPGDPQGMLWRGKINAISGFSLGQLNPE